MDDNKSPSLIEAQRQFGLAIDTALVQVQKKLRRTKREERDVNLIAPPSVRSDFVGEAAFNLGLATAQEGDQFSFLERGDLGETVTFGVAKIQSEFGSMANTAFARATKIIGDAEAKVRASDQKLATWLIATIIGATVIIDSVAAHNALSIVWNAAEYVTWGAAVAIAGLLAIAGWIIAVTSVSLIGRIALWIGLVLSVISVIAVGWTAAELRGIQQSKESIQVQITDLQESIALLDAETPPEELTNDLQGLQLRLQDLNASFDTYVLYFYAGLILFTVCVASLAKAFEAHQQGQTYDKRTTNRQLERGKELAKADSAVDALEAWIPMSNAVSDLGGFALSRYFEGFRAGLSAAQLDDFRKNPPKVAQIPRETWTSDFQRRIEILRGRLDGYRGDLGMPETN